MSSTEPDLDNALEERAARKFGRSRKHRSSGTAYFRRVSCFKKRRFRTEDEAKRWCQRLRPLFEANGNTFDAQRIYECEVCQGFHTTHILGVLSGGK